MSEQSLTHELMDRWAGLGLPPDKEAIEQLLIVRSENAVWIVVDRPNGAMDCQFFHENHKDFKSLRGCVSFYYSLAKSKP